MAAYGFEWEDYPQRFIGTRPIELTSSNIYPRKMELEQAIWEEGVDSDELASGPYEIIKIDREYKVIVESKYKVTKEQLQDTPYLEC